MEVVELEEINLIGYSISVLEHEVFVKLPHLYKLFYEKYQDIKEQLAKLIIEVTYGRNGSVINKFVGISVEKDTEIPQGMELLTISKANYLYYTHIGSGEGVYDTFVDMYDFALEKQLKLPIEEFKLEMYDDVNKEWHLYLKLE